MELRIAFSLQIVTYKKFTSAFYLHLDKEGVAAGYTTRHQPQQGQQPGRVYEPTLF